MKLVANRTVKRERVNTIQTGCMWHLLMTCEHDIANYCNLERERERERAGECI